MLVLHRKRGERLYVDYHDTNGKRIRIVITVAGKSTESLKLGITAPRSVKVMREELISTDDREPFEEGCDGAQT